MDNSAFGIPEPAPDNLENTEPRSRQSQMYAYLKQQEVLLKLVWRSQPQLANSDPKPRPIIANVVDRGDRD